MRRSTDRILTTHTGSLPRPEPLMTLLRKIERGEATDSDRAAFPDLVRRAVAEVVGHQLDSGVDIVNDGEMSKVSYSTYITERASGFGGRGAPLTMSDYFDFPGYAESLGIDIDAVMAFPACIDDVRYRPEQVHTDITNLTDALSGRTDGDAFLSAASPGVISAFLQNQHYPDHDSYLDALAEAMKTEYDAIHAAGFLVQLDCPDLAMGRHLQFPDLSLDDWRSRISRHVEVINHATRDIPADRLRMHLCWGNYEGPHTRDVPLTDVLDIVLRARPGGLSLEGANPRHEHEWRVFEDVTLPEDKILIPGVIDSTSNYVEHPELVAQRITRLAELVGRENVIASSDCGFGTASQVVRVFPTIVWAKMRAMADGAALASRALWGSPVSTG